MAKHGNSTIDQPFWKTVAITKSDATTYDPPIEAFLVGADGNVNLKDSFGNTNVIACIAGHIYRISCTQILSTSTTATGIVALYY
jgi:hypothetical protein